MTPKRPHVRSTFLTKERRLPISFHTSSLPKFLQARLVGEKLGVFVDYFRGDTEPYEEQYDVPKDDLLDAAIREMRLRVGVHRVFFVEDTSVRIDALSGEREFPGLGVKEWFSTTTFLELDRQIRQAGGSRGARIDSDIALHVPGLEKPVFFHGSTHGMVAKSPSGRDSAPQYPWLDPRSFSGWFIPDRASRPLSDMDFEESWEFDFRVRSLVQMFDRLEEYSAILNLQPTAYERRRPTRGSAQIGLFEVVRPVLLLIGRTCAGKTTLGEYLSMRHGMRLVEASSIVRMLSQRRAESVERDPQDAARDLLGSEGPDIVARTIIEHYGDEPQGLVVTGFRAIEEIEAMLAHYPRAQVVLVRASDRIRYERHIRRGRHRDVASFDEFRRMDEAQNEFGLLRSAADFADFEISNEGSLDDLFRPFDAFAVVGIGDRREPKGRAPREESQLLRILGALCDSGEPRTARWISAETSIRANNVHKMLRDYPELVDRRAGGAAAIQYVARPAGEAYVRLTRFRRRK